MSNQANYLAVILLSSGGSSHGYGDTIAEAADRCFRFFTSDWRPSSGMEVRIAVYDVSKFPLGQQFVFDMQGVRTDGSENKAAPRRLDPVQIVERIT